MLCPHCGAEMRLKTQFCPSCGQRVEVSMGDIFVTAHAEAAERRGKIIGEYVRFAVWVLGILLLLIVGLAYLYDKPLVFVGYALPSLPARAEVTKLADARKPLLSAYVEPRPMPPIPHSPDRRLGYRKDPTRGFLRLGNAPGGPDTAHAITLGLNFLASQQDRDGSWPVFLFPKTWGAGETADFQWGKTGVTGLALLAMLGDGHSWLKEDTGTRNPFADNTANAVRYLLSMQDPVTGRFGAGEGERVHFMYNHAMATLALAEAAAASGDDDLRARVTKAVAYIVKTQTPNGGWNYFGHADSDDISVTAWQVQALAAAQEAGIEVPEETFTRAYGMFRKATVGERVVYRLQNDDGIYTPSLAGMGLMLRQLCGESNASPDLKQIAGKLGTLKLKIKPEWTRGWNPSMKDGLERGKFDPYMLYYCSYGMFFLGGSDWEAWRQNMVKAILDMQEGDGSWRCNDVNTLKAGTSYSTALCVLSLQCSYRIAHSISTGDRGANRDE